MNELEKKQHFSMKNLSDTVTTTPIRDDIYQLEPLKEVTPPKYKTLSQAYREFSFRKEMIDDIQSAIEKEPDATWTEKVGAGVDRAVLRIKQSPAQVRNLLYRNLYSGIDYPNADMKQALDIAEASSYQMYLENQSLSGKQQREGTADSIIANLTEGGLSLGEFALLNFATGGTVGTAIMGAQEAGSLSQQFAESDIEKGQLDTKGTIKENITAIAYGALAGWIEKGIGAEAALGQTWREIFKSGGKSAVAKTFGKEAAKRGLGEGTEEFLQGEAEWAAGKFVGKEQRTFYDGMMDSLISGVYGAILGGSFGGVSAGFENGVTRYYKARSDMIERMTSAGMDPDVAANLADQALTDTTSLIVNELSGRNSLHAHFGEDWDKLVDGVAQAYIAQGWQEKNPDKDVLEFARMNAVAMVAPVIQLSNRTNTPLKQILDLTKFRANQNALFIDLPNMDDPKALGVEIKNRKAEIKRLRGLPATDTAKRVKQLREQIKILELRLESLENYNALQKSRMNAKKANLDNNVLASTKPEVMANLQNIRQASDNESFVYVGNNQVPVRYVVKPMAEVQTSHVAGEPNPKYTLKELQNRTRGTVTDDAILQNRAANLKPEELAESPNTQYGAPVVNKNGEVISGNGRIETLRRAYELGNTSYKEMLDKLGYNTEGIERPVLVRETVDDLTPEQQVAIAEASNVSETSAFDHARQAMNDAKLLRKGVSDPLALADELPVNERQAYIRENGQYDMLALQRRFDDAVLAWIIGDTKTFDSLVLANRLSQKVVKGLSLQGGNIVDFSNKNPALGIKKDLRYALVKSASIKNRGQFLGEVMQQDVESGVTFNADAMLYAMTFSNNSSELSNFLGDYIQTHQGYIDGQKDSFLADSLPKLSKEDITHQVLLKNPLTASKFDNTGLCTDGNLKAVITNKIPVEDIGYGTIKVEPEESQLFQEQFNLANENARLDDIYPEYKGETINIDGKERTFYNSNGDRIAKSKEALENFYKWFGDSKVVDEQGRPKVMYHGTPNAIYDTLRAGTYFTDNKAYAEVYKSQGASSISYKKEAVKPDVYAVYIKMEKPFDTRNKEARDDFYKYYYQQMGMGTDLQESGLPDWNDGRDLLEFITEYHPELGYDGILLDEGGVGGYGEDVKSRGISYVNISPNQIKSTSNRGTYSLDEDKIYNQDEDDRDLVVLHSISPANLRKSIEFGGFAVPSLAIVRKGQEFHFDNLPITLVGNKQMIDPYDERNEVYNRDVWTKTFPYVTYKKPTQAKEKNFKNKIGEYYKRTNGENELGSFLYVAQRGNTGSALSEFANSSGAILYYLENIKKQKVEFSEKDLAEDILKRADIDEKLANEIQGLDVNENREKITQAFRSFLERKEKEDFSDIKDPEKREKMIKFSRKLANENYFDSDGNLKFYKADTITTAAYNYSRSKGKKFIDQYEVRRQLKDIIKDDENYQEWATEFFEKELVGDKMVEVGNKLKPFTLDNVVEAMTIGKTVASQNTPLPAMGKVIASGAKKLESIKDIKEEGKKLVTDEQSRENMEKVTEALYDFLNMFDKDTSFEINMDRKDAVATALSEVVKNKNISKESLRKAILRNLPSEKTVSEETLSYGVDLADKIKSLARYYFEAKPQRAVRLNEFSGAIIPTDTKYDAIAERVEKEGLKVVRSDNQVEALNQFEDVYFQKGKNINGYFDAELKTIVIGSSFNFGTMQHEFAHFFLDRIFNIYKTGEGTPEFNEWFSQLSSILDIKADQNRLTTEQQEHFARMTEAYLFNKGVFPENAKPAMQMFFDWCPTEYNELLSIGYKDENGVYHNSIFNKESLEFFDEMYSLVQTLSDSPTARTFTNDTNRNGTKLHTTTEMIKERERIISDNEVVPEEPKLEDQSPEIIQKTLEMKRMPDPEVESAYTEALEVEKERKKTLGEKFTQYVRIGRGTNTREEMDRVAQEYIKNNRENAERVAFGNPIPSGLEEETGNSDAYVDNNTGIDRAVLILNLMKEYPETSAEYGQLYHNFAIYRSYASKSAGLTNDISTNYYLKGYAEINKALQEKAALVRYGKANNAVNLWNRDIDRFISQNIDKVYNTEPESAEREKAIKQFIDDATATFAGDKLLYQEDLRISKAKDKRAFIDWANRTVRQIAKGKISGIDQAELLRLSIEAQKGASFIDSNDINEAVAASQAIRAWQDFVNNKGVPEKLMDKIIGSYLPSAMLSSPSTHALNYISNTFNNFAVKIASRLHYGANVIDNEVLQQEYQRLKAIYAESGHNISEDIKPDDVSRLHGENWQFKKPTSKIGYLAPMRLLGWSDFNFRAHTYIDVLARIASSDAKGDPKKALELFNDYKMMNNTGRAKEARVEAIMTGHIAVFTKNGVLSNVSSRVRAGLDYINLVDPGKAGHKGLGTLVMPFAKVPANIVGMGIEAVASPFKLLGKWTGLKQDWTLQDTINLTNFGMYASIVGIYLMAGLDYEPPYEPPAKYEPQKPYDSIKIGNAWVSVESFGALANPLRFTFTMLDMVKNGKKMDQALVKAAGGLKNDIPFLSVDFENDYMKRKPADWLVSTTYNQISKGVPAILKKPIAWMNREFGLEISQNSALKKKIARQYGLDGEQTTINDYLSWIYRGIKIER